MSLLERMSPLQSPSSKGNCARGYLQIPKINQSTDTFTEFPPRIGDRNTDFNAHKYYYRSQRKQSTSPGNSFPKSHTSAQLLSDDSFLQGYVKKNSIKQKEDATEKIYFPSFERLRKDQFYIQYLHQSSIKLSQPLQEKIDVQEKYQEQKDIIENQYQKENFAKTVDEILKSSPRSNWQSSSPHVQILTPKLHSKEGLDEQKEVSLGKITPIIQSSINLPEDFIDCSIDHLIVLISRMLKSLILLNDSNVPKSISNPQAESESGNRDGKSSLLTRYHSRTPPSISIPTYLSRLTKFNNFTTATLLTTIYYIDLLSHHYQPFFTLNSWTVHRFLLVGTMLSQKSMEDFFYTNDHYAKVGGVAVSELNCLELDFLAKVDWKCIPAKQLENGKSSIKFAKDVLDLYYTQLIQLMGKNVSDGDQNYFEFRTSTEEILNQNKEIYDSDDDTINKGTASYDENKEQENQGYEEENEDYDSDEEIEYHRSPGTFPISVSNKGSSTEKTTNTAALGINYSNKFDAFGYSIDGSSSPHLKRRFSIQSED